ncbi:MAG: hypothetical protein M3Y87_20910 [Myxococcota bacterium]|nr:hypothetical protein [Myxococcota bacterium]
MRAGYVACLLTVVCLLTACDEPVVPGVDAGLDAFFPPLRPRDAGPELCAAEGPLDARVPLSDLDLCAEGIVPMGLGLRWQTQSQRLARFQTRIDLGDHSPAGCAPGAAMRGATLDIAASGGAVVSDPDPAVVFFDYQVLGPTEPGGAATDAGTTRRRTARGSVTIDLAPGVSDGEGLAFVDLAGAGIADAAHFAVVVDGLELTTDLSQAADYPPTWAPERGYASRGIGAAITDVARDGDTLRVRASARFEHGELDQPSIDPGHDVATRVARRRAIVRFVVVVSDVAVSSGSVAYDVRARAGDPLEGGAPCRGAESEMQLEIDGDDGRARGVVGITRFDVALWPDAERIGDRLREISVRVRDLDYDAASGTARMRVDAYASNEGPFPRRGMDARVEVDVALAQWDGGGPVVPVSIAAPLEVGQRTIELPLR